MGSREEIESWIRLFRKIHGERARTEAEKLARTYRLEEMPDLARKWAEVARRV